MSFFLHALGAAQRILGRVASKGSGSESTRPDAPRTELTVDPLPVLRDPLRSS